MIPQIKRCLNLSMVMCTCCIIGIISISAELQVTKIVWPNSGLSSAHLLAGLASEDLGESASSIRELIPFAET